MSSEFKGRLVILSGPSCVGKSPLVRALGRFHREWSFRLQPLVLYNSRSPRPGEVDGIDYHFRTRRQIEAFRRNSQYVVLEARGDLQALDLEELQSLLRSGDVVYEGNPFVAVAMLTHASLRDVTRLSVFFSPLTKEEIIYLRAPERNLGLEDLVTDIMRRKLLRRTRRQKGELSAKDLENVERRASSAYSELREARHFDYVIPNHDGEDSDNWEAFYFPLGDARNSLSTFVSLLEGKVPANVEKWDADLLPGDD